MAAFLDLLVRHQNAGCQKPQNQAIEGGWWQEQVCGDGLTQKERLQKNYPTCKGHALGTVLGESLDIPQEEEAPVAVQL